MKNIWKIFRADVSHIKNNVIALIVILGLTVVPALYAWFNIAASWDPTAIQGGSGWLWQTRMRDMRAALFLSRSIWEIQSSQPQGK